MPDKKAMSWVSSSKVVSRLIDLASSGGITELLSIPLAVTKQGSGIRIINEPLSPEAGGSVVFVVETGEASSLPETRYIVDWLNSYLEPKGPQPACIG